jgi:hypothetical protein
MHPPPRHKPANENAPSPRLTPAPPKRECDPLTNQLTMGQQYNKGIKKKRRLAYLKRKKEAAKKAPAKKTAKAKK